MVDNKFPLIEKARAWFHRQPSTQQKNIKKYGTISVFVLGALGIYYITGQDKKKPVEPTKQEDITQAKTDSYIQDDIVSSLGGKIQNLESGIDGKVKDAVADAVQKGQFNLTPPPSASNTETPPVDLQGTSNNAGSTTSGAGTADYPGMNSYPTPSAYNAPSAQAGSADANAAEEPSVIWVGGISDGNGDIAMPSTPEDSSAKKNEIQLPVGFMKAKLLVGVNALTGQYGSDNPQTLMFRVQAPAQLPNFIKMNLRGCFVIANASGNLSSERIIVLPVSMHCMTMDGGYIVEGDVTGFVSDRDGKRDMSARVVSRAGRLLASTVFAKSIEGFSNVIGNQSIQQNVSPLGSINTIKPDEATKNAAATGVAGGFTEVSKYLLNLAQQTSPALETGPGKDVTLFVQKTAALEIKQVRIK
ncbi:TraB/VirB10 family protein [Shigella sonnei]|uniref:TraB/VirB10 family protein n=1 Tax=Escherichia coli TaxID=562 RepID=UPI0009D127BD|nr:TraB/VirB10 family protein [Escherichia coli]EDW6767801.1 conjugal transfer protein TraB [Salmonella enterica subsp. enterica serovar Johannesburg]EFV9881541.1 conjugal transfer protein TraB [Shigella sonnei]EKJ2619667.1 TraB/VirB10 family protein [Shigella flexneri]HAC8092465.1 conjugal transfer protein TraB [Salmonella enterica subsp. enterica serovar Enteritidis]HBN2914264.1 TraB/VirB10 family protein [Escherichia coli O25b:H4-ST131]